MPASSNESRVVVASDALQRQREIAELYRARLHLVYEHAADLVAYLNADGRIVTVPDQCRMLRAYPGVFSQGVQFSGLLDTKDQPAFLSAVSHAALADEPRSVDVRLSGHNVWLRCRVAAVPPLTGQGKMLLVLGTDISAWKNQGEELSHLATHDYLTGLPNRILLQDRVDQLVASANRAHFRFALLLMDLDGFKLVNDTLGHAAGDSLLQDAASRLKRVVREQDTVARLGGDEFVVLLADTPDRATVDAVATRVSQVIRQPYEVQGNLVHVSASIGCAFFPEHGRTQSELLKNADVAMYQAKEQGRDRFVVYDPAHHGYGAALTLESAMHQGLEKGEFHLAYQPIFGADGGVQGCEALMRWTQADGKVVPPSDFIPLAESNGLIALLGHWALRTACAQGAQWRQLHGRDITMAVNVSPRQLTEHDFVGKVKAALDAAGLPPHCLALEITEGALMRDPVRASELLGDLTQMGVRLAVDDFGTGYSSLAYLKHFPIDTLKIDRSFVIGLESDQADQAIVAAVLGMARNLGIRTVAEGVETEGQLDFLRANGCARVQGYLTGRPVSPDVFATEHFAHELAS